MLQMMMNPQMMQQAMSMMGPGGMGSQLGGLGGMGTQPGGLGGMGGLNFGGSTGIPTTGKF